MRTRLVPPILLLCLALMVSWASSAPTARAADDRPARPTLIIRVSSIDDLVADGRYLAELAGREEQARQLEKLVRSMTGQKGIDSERPFGLYAKLGAGGAEDSEAVLMLPVADEKAF